MNLRTSVDMEAGPYPERPGAPDCSYYVRTGLCRFGMTCRFNHPVNRKLAAAAARIRGGYPEIVGQPECQYYLKTGTCKFGATCKFHHPRENAGIAGKVQLNLLGYPLRPNEMECSYYLRTGECKFAHTCKFHHPQPSSAMVALHHGSSVYSSATSAITPGQQPYPGGLMNWSLSRASFVPSPRWEGSSSYTQLVVPQGVVQVPSWNPFSGQSGEVSSPQSQRQALVASQYNATLNQSKTSTGGPGTSSFLGSVPIDEYAVQTDHIFPERPDQPECQFYMKTGDCKFGTVCRFHHPRERPVPAPDCILSPLGLPLRPGEPLCIFYSRYGICKFGPNCKFDHPVATPLGIYSYGPSDVPMVQRLLGSSSSPIALTLSSGGPVGPSTGRPRNISSDSGAVASSEGAPATEGPHTNSSDVKG